MRIRFAGVTLTALLFTTTTTYSAIFDVHPSGGSVALPDTDARTLEAPKLLALSGKGAGPATTYEIRGQTLFALYWQLIELENSLVELERSRIIDPLWQAGNIYQSCYDIGLSGYVSNVCRIRARYMYEQAVLMSKMLGVRRSDYEDKLRIARKSDAEWRLNYKEAFAARSARLRNMRSQRDRALPPTESERLALDNIERENLEIFSAARALPLGAIETSALSGNIGSAKKLHLAAKKEGMIGVAMFWGMVYVENSMLCDRGGRSSGCEGAAISMRYFCRFLSGIAGIQNKTRSTFWCDKQRGGLFGWESVDSDLLSTSNDFDIKEGQRGEWGLFWERTEK